MAALSTNTANPDAKMPRAIQVAGVFALANQTVTSAQVLLIATELAQTSGDLQAAIGLCMVDQAYESLTALLAYQSALDLGL